MEVDKGDVIQVGCCLETGWTLVCLWEVTSDFLCIAFSLPLSFIYYTVFILTHKFTCFCSSCSVLCLTAGRLSEWVSEWAVARLTGCYLVFKCMPIRCVVKHIWLSGIYCLLSKSCSPVEHIGTSQRVMANKQYIRARLHDLKDNSYKRSANSQLKKICILSNMFLWS